MYRTVYELTHEELIELKARYLDDLLEDRNASYGELAEADSIITDEIVFNEFAGTVFTEDDFWCNL